MTRDYKSTVFLPRTDFPMKADLPAKEPELLRAGRRWGLYARLREVSAGRPKFVLHDGPPYANGHIHVGHALNKILKDVVNRSQQMLGKDAPYVPGWDCHGLPIEWQIEQEYRKKGKDKDAVPIVRLPPRMPRVRAALDRHPARRVQAPGRARRLGRPLHDHDLPGRGRHLPRARQVPAQRRASTAARSR